MRKKLTRFAFKYLLGFVRFWYGLTMFLTRKKVTIPVYSAPSEITEALSHGRMYKTDPLRGALDVLNHPTKTQRRINAKEKVGDCDDHAMYWCTALLESDLAAHVYFGWYQYIDAQGKQKGHALCIFRDAKGWWYADYGLPTPVKGMWDFATRDAQHRGATPIAAGLSKITLKRGGPHFNRPMGMIL